MDIALSRLDYEQMILSADQHHPMECCGLLLGQIITPNSVAHKNDNDGNEALLSDNIANKPNFYNITHIKHVQNIAQNKSKFFEMDPATLIAAHKEARLNGPKILGYYHSHPNGLAQPSAHDAQTAAEDGKIWMIIANGQITAWQTIHNGKLHSKFNPMIYSIVN